MSNPKNAGQASKRLTDKKELILQLWEKRCIEEVTAAKRVTVLTLRNSIPLYLDHLSECLATNSKLDFNSVFEREKDATRISKRHGADRADHSAYNLTEVIFEYHILREVIFQILENEGPIDVIQRDIVLDSIEQAVNDSAVEFSEIQTGIQQKFIDTLTHDLKTPITSAKLNAELIIKRTQNSEPAKLSAKRIVTSMKRLESMIHDLLDGSRVRGGEKLVLQLSKCDLDMVIRDVVEDMAVVHGNRIVFDSNEPIVGMWYEDGLRRAVENLIGNAVKYGNPHTPITISLRKEKDEICIRVHNYGQTIPEQEIPKLFTLYHRSKNALEGTQTGWGLGLTLVKGVMDAMKGIVRVKSQNGYGTSFDLCIPTT